MNGAWPLSVAMVPVQPNVSLAFPRRSAVNKERARALWADDD